VVCPVAFKIHTRLASSMNKKRALMFAVVLGILGVLIYFQFRTWQRFDWQKFMAVTGDLWHGSGMRHLIIAVALIYLTYWLRAVRWKLFLKPVCRAKLSSLVPTQYIGFTGLALLGRPGELIRPYLIAKKENLTMSSQLAVWTVERIFDIGAFTVLISINVFLFGHRLPHTEALYKAAGALLALVAGMGLGALLVRRNSHSVAGLVERACAPFAPKLGTAVASKIRAFGEGLNTIHDGRTFLQLAGVSLGIWFVIALAYRYVLHAYSQPVLHHMHVPQVLLLMASSMVGSMIQLPAIGGGSQLAVISMLSSAQWFAVPQELAVSAGMLLWLVTFMAVIPLGLALSRHEHLSIRKLTEETAAQEAQAAVLK
jgi:uncharacterized protein (TIRG00374 family)